LQFGCTHWDLSKLAQLDWSHQTEVPIPKEKIQNLTIPRLSTLATLAIKPQLCRHQLKSSFKVNTKLLGPASQITIGFEVYLAKEDSLFSWIITYTVSDTASFYHQGKFQFRLDFWYEGQYSCNTAD